MTNLFKQTPISIEEAKNIRTQVTTLISKLGDVLREQAMVSTVASTATADVSRLEKSVDELRELTKSVNSLSNRLYEVEQRLDALSVKKPWWRLGK